MPANVTALILKARPGQELVCRAEMYGFQVNAKKKTRGVISHYVSLALAKAFQTMLGLKLEVANCGDDCAAASNDVVGTIGFAGKARGSVCLGLDIPSATIIATRILNLDGKTPPAPDEINDAVGELLNIMTGNFKSNLCDAGLDCKLETPKVSRASLAGPAARGKTLTEHMAFRTHQLQVFVDVTVDPWNQE